MVNPHTRNTVSRDLPNPNCAILPDLRYPSEMLVPMTLISRWADMDNIGCFRGSILETVLLVCSICWLSSMTCFSSCARAVSRDTTSDLNTKLFDSTKAVRLSASAVLPPKSAISRPEITLSPNAATTSRIMPAIKIRHPRSNSDFCIAATSSRMSGSKLSGGMTVSALFSMRSPQYTTSPPDILNSISAQNHGDETNFKSKFIYALLCSIPNAILLTTFAALLFRCKRRRRRRF